MPGEATVQKLDRRIFATSRLAEFTSVKELTAQTGHTPDAWPLVIVKELVDNALDAAEKAGITPEIKVDVDEDRIVVTDNGGGITPETVARILDYQSRTSDKEAYVSPTRGAQGNALKTVLAMPFALDGTKGKTVIESRGIRHTITFAIDPIRREPKIEHSSERSLVKKGTRITVHLRASPWSEDDQTGSRFLQVGQDFAALNPHLALKVMDLRLACTDPAWSKWTPADAIPAHWYRDDRFDRLIAAHIADDQDRGRSTTVREFVATFRGMSGTAKQKPVLESTGTARMSLSDFYANGRNPEAVRRLLSALQKCTKPVKAADLGVIGRDHIEAQFAQADAEMGSFEYVRQTGQTKAGLPFVLEVAFAWCPDGVDERRLITGLNFSPTLANPFRSLGPYGESLDEVLTRQRAGSEEPILVLVHLACPIMAFTDRGKSQLVVDSPTGEAITKAVLAVTKKWCRTRQQEEKHAAEVERRRAKMFRSREVSFKKAAYEVMEEAWLKASADGTLPANARQIMYAARRQIQDMTGKPLNDKYFTQTLLPDYVTETGVDWDVVFDDRGHFDEPHTGAGFGVGTVNVREYLANRRRPSVTQAALVASSVVTSGPEGNYGAILFIEKEGFAPLLQRVRLAERYDIAIMSTKGTSVTAARRLVETLCCGDHAIPLLILHDFDKSAFSIASTLTRNTRRYQFTRVVKVIDLGLRLVDIRDLGLESCAEEAHDTGSRESRARNLRLNGATEEEIEFLLDRRVELNALTSDQLVRLIETKLNANGIRKIVPEKDLLARTYEEAVRTKQVREIVDRVLRDRTAPVAVPNGLRRQVEALLREHPEMRWDEAVRIIARDAD